MIFDFNDGWTLTKENGESFSVCLPHDAMPGEKRYPSCRNAVQSGYFPGGKYRYTKTFQINESDLGKNIRLHFGGVYRNALVSVNGEAVKENKYGYSPFTADLTEKVTSGKNTVEVLADNSLVPNCRWYSGSGIYRPVYLEISRKDAPTFLKIKTVGISPAVIEVDTDDGAEIQIFDAEGSLAARGQKGRFEISGAHLWSAEAPYLYTCKVSRDGEELTEKFGIRTLEWSGKTGLLVNGKETLLRGGCIHHDNGVLGACSFADAEERRVRILKSQGFNALRMAHNPVSRSLLDACDRIGMYVMDEAFDGWYIPKEYHDYSRDFLSDYKSVLAAMVENDYNHPSVIMYSLGNEVTETASKRGVELCAEMRDTVHSLDGTRPVTCGINVLLDVYARLGIGVYSDKKEYKREPLPEGKGYKEKKSGSAFFNYWAEKLGKLFFALSKTNMAEKVVSDISPALDIVGLNYASSRYDKDAEKYPDRLMIGTETMSADLPYNWNRVLRHKQLIGDFVWSAWDYIGETCMGWTYQSYKGLPLLSGQGMIDITGLPLAQMAFLRTVWGTETEPFLAVRPLDHSGETPSKGAWQFTNALDSWTWHGFEGKPTVAEVYTTADSVRLELNGKVIGTKKVRKNKALFSVKYAPGTLTAIALDKSGNEAGRTQLISGEKAPILTVKPDRSVLPPDGQALCFAEIEFTDKSGTLLPYMEQRVDIKIDGNAVTLQGFGSALTKTDEVFIHPYHNTYRGRALAVFRAGKADGKSTVTVSSENTEPVSFSIEVTGGKEE